MQHPIVSKPDLFTSDTDFVLHVIVTKNVISCCFCEKASDEIDAQRYLHTRLDGPWAEGSIRMYPGVQLCGMYVGSRASHTPEIGEFCSRRASRVMQLPL